MQSTPSPMDSLAAFALAFLAGVFTTLLWMAYLEASLEDAPNQPKPEPPPEHHSRNRFDVDLFETRIHPASPARNRSETLE